MSWLKGLADKVGLGDQLAALSKDKNFMEGAMAAAAWVAAADKTIGEKEKSKVAGFITRSEFLKSFDRLACIAQFNNYASEFEFDYGMGSDRARKEIGDVKDPNKLLNIARLAVAIAASEADEGDKDPISDAERGVIREICVIGSIDPKTVGI